MTQLLAFIPSMPGPMEMLIVGGIAVLLFGNRLPSVARSLGSTFVEFKRGLKGLDDGAKELNADLNKQASEIQKEISK